MAEPAAVMACCKTSERGHRCVSEAREGRSGVSDGVAIILMAAGESNSELANPVLGG